MLLRIIIKILQLHELMHYQYHAILFFAKKKDQADQFARENFFHH